ncbi:STAS domain-containing protein [Alteribacter aurantiacus]|uniref:STAS domain-containing protein n=1 Tax=Alteribacter aurantiacus TaxID=254410 RepID=UPI0003FCCA96|nr:STAS domain-containing protein [Alteribacter aurantiacus]
MVKVNDLQIDTIKLLGSLTDNVFITNREMELTWMNDHAKKLVNNLLPFIPDIKSPEDLIGMSIQELHPSSSNFFRVMKRNIFPHQSKIPIFGYMANLLVNKLYDHEGEHNGYILFWRDVTKEENQRIRNERLIEEMSTPILPVVLENALFAPLIGTFDEKRFDHLRERVLSACVKLGADYLIFDFSGVTVVEDEVIITEFEKLRATVQLLGAETYFCGFSSSLVQTFVRNKVKVEERTFSHYRQAIQHILGKEGLEIVPKKNHEPR